MAKGFTVKANPPAAKKEPEWDYDKAKELLKGKSVVFCLPGKQNTTDFPCTSCFALS